jgi:hypothetical protein
MASSVLEIARDIVTAWAQKATPGGDAQTVGKYFGEVYKGVVAAVVEAQDATFKGRN